MPFCIQDLKNTIGEVLSLESSLYVTSRNHTGEVLWLYLDRDLFNVAGGRNRGTYLGCVVSAERQPRSWMD
jgi:hypothetical protein